MWITKRLVPEIRKAVKTLGMLKSWSSILRWRQMRYWEHQEQRGQFRKWEQGQESFPHFLHVSPHLAVKRKEFLVLY